MQNQDSKIISERAEKISKYVKEYGPLLDKYSNEEFTSKFEHYEQMAGEYEKKGEQDESFWFNTFENDGEKEKKIQDFNNTLLFRFPENGPLSIGIYKGDIIRGMFLGADLGVDWYFYKKLTDYCVENLFEKVTKNVDGVIRIFIRMADNLNSKDKKLKKLSEDELIKFMENNFSFDYFSLMKNSFVRHLLFYLFLTEVSRNLKNQFLGHRDIKSLAVFWHRLGTPLKSNSLRNYIFGKPIPISNVIEGWFIASRPLTSGIGYFSYLFNSVLTVVEVRPEFLDSYWLLFVKEVSILLLSIKTIYRNVYQKSFFSYVKAFSDELIPLLKTYKFEREKFKGTVKVGKSKFLEIEKKIKDFICKAYDFSFNFWLKNKNYCFKENEFWVNLVLNGFGVSGKLAIKFVSPYLSNSKSEG